ncbi:unnamed protein product [Dracunculus medinensis]|uniref:Protein Red n=1 Tax=Dracunculus medinensis TaxID=318479 RepID=A0A0N4UR14_DRAME|nr:unnamed protein product [Dracunculus medinensis]
MDGDISEITGGSTAIARITSGTLRNEDFRQLLSRKAAQSSTTSSATTTSITPSSNASQNQATHSFSHRQTNESKRNQNSVMKGKKQKERDEQDEDDFFGPSNLTEILKNYRDRAEERRKGIGKEDSDDLQANNAYRAVPSDIRATADAAQRRKQAIQESKYLGGDMEHTHLVKGLDYSLLHKVRSEIAMREQKNEEMLESQYSKDNMEEIRSDNPMVRSIYRILFQNELPYRNELFRKGRMAYVIDLEEEENDLPTTRLRSIHDCPAAESSNDINTSNLLIQKLTQVLSYLRTDSQKKKKKLEMEERNKLASEPIFDSNISKTTSDRDRRRERDNYRERDRDRRRLKPSSYFEDNGRDDRDKEREKLKDRERHRDHDKSNRDRERDRRNKEEDKRDYEKRREEIVKYAENVPPSQKKKKSAIETEGYAECYPGGIEMYEAADMRGNRRGPIKRWDFDDHDEYEKYMESKEAMPKAAYQFGVKTNDGRKTRKSGADKEKHKLDREYSQITKILEKRKIEGQKS